MIVRIMGEGQYDVPDAELDRLNELDDAVEKAVEKAPGGGDDADFAETLGALHGRVRSVGTRLDDASLVASDVVLPPAGVDVDEVRHLFDDDGLVPGR